MASNGADPFLDDDTNRPISDGLDNTEIASMNMRQQDRRHHASNPHATTQSESVSERQQNAEEIGPELQNKLAELEKEWNDIGKDNARAFSTKTRYSSGSVEGMGTPHVLRGEPRDTPAKLHVPPKSKRATSANRVHDIEFAAEISASLLNQVRTLQAVIAEKEDALRNSNNENTRLLIDTEALRARLRSLDDDEEKFKDYNWNLETRVQDLNMQAKEASEREERLTKALSALESDKSTAQRDFEDIKQSHERLNDDHTALQKHFDTELHTLRHSLSAQDSARVNLQRKIDELTGQNQELARAVAYRVKSDAEADLVKTEAMDMEDQENITPENSPPPSPTKATPRHGGLEHETLKTSLTHAHRMIQNLKNNIHREKTEKVELRRMLQDARDELETRQVQNNLAPSSVRRPKQAQEFKKPAVPGKLGGRKDVSEEIWEDLDQNNVQNQQSIDRPALRTRPSTDQSDSYATATENSDAYATATENETTHGTDAYATAESVAGDDTDDLTETEAGQASRPKGVVQSIETRPRTSHRDSFRSTASDEEVVQPVVTPSDKRQRQQARFSRDVSGSPSVQDSPASFISNYSHKISNNNLAAELGDFGEDSSVASDTPSRSLASREHTPALAKTPTSRQTSPRVPGKLPPTLLSVFQRPKSKDNSTMTDLEEVRPGSQDSILTARDMRTTGTDTSDLEAVFDVDADSSFVQDNTKEIESSVRQPPVQDLAFSSLELQSITPIPPRPKKTFIPLPVKVVSTTPLANESRHRSDTAKQAETAVSDSRGIKNRQGKSIDSPPPPALSFTHVSPPQVPLSRSKATSSSGSQTTLTGQEIEKLAKGRNRAAVLVAPSTPYESPTPSPVGSPVSALAGPSFPERPSDQELHPALRASNSAGSIAKDYAASPPLPSGHKQAIAAASRGSNSQLASPPNKASASASSSRPQTPSFSARNAGGSPGVLRTNVPQKRTASHPDRAQRESVSSFATEIDERFNVPDGMEQYDAPGTDPRMIAAITQTMIGEFLWKYTRKPGRGDLSANRHRRFFWIHPYTRTLYWSTQDPGAAGRSELKAKSVPIDAVRVVGDENIVPPGLYSKSLVVVTPGRSIKFTAPTSYRHDTWFNALSYLLLRGSGDQGQAQTQLAVERSNTTALADTMDVDPHVRASSRTTQHSQHSINSATKPVRIGNAPNFSHRAPSPQGARPVPNYSSRSGQASARLVQSPTRSRSSTLQGQAPGSGLIVGSTSHNQGDRAGDYGEFKKPALPRTSFQNPSLYSSPNKATSSKSINESLKRKGSIASKISNSLSSFGRRYRSDGRAEQEERQREAALEDAMDQYRGHSATPSISGKTGAAGRLENVRACCDGKHDVAHLHHRSTSRAASVASAGRRSLSGRTSRSHLAETEH